MSEDRTADGVLDLLGDEYARSILAAVSTDAMSAAELGEHCDMSVSTVYRRAEALVERDLLVERVRIDPDGHHESVFEPAVERLAVEVRDGSLDVDIEQPNEDAVDRFTRVWEDIRES
ncbi:helix-turn-helix domain-containing protein [Halobaculum limi]|uniref:helix-turn-helix domain-containing protein n=1 Tax=Halobaculum limi TaxID=3031916 RepID=UPI0024062036|nr:helix-turn-helix domain-containing protein [Halobaculum sp. YSMS11]